MLNQLNHFAPQTTVVYQSRYSQNACQKSKQCRPRSDCFFRNSSSIWVCTVCLGHFARQLVFQILEHLMQVKYSKTCVKRLLLKRPKICFQDQLSLNAGQKYCSMLQREHSAILLTFIKLPFAIMIFFFVYF